MKFKFTNIFRFCLAVLALSCSLIVSAASSMEWREVYRMDFGGDDASDPDMSTTALSTSEMITELGFLNRYIPEGGSADKYFITKSTSAVKNDTRSAMVDNGWLDGSDHTYPNDKSKGYFMMFDCNSNQDQFKVFEKSLPISCTGVNFKFSCWFANLAKDVNNSDCKISVGIYKDDSDLLSGGDVVDIPMSNSSELGWVNYSTTFKVPDDFVGSNVLFIIYAEGCYANAGWDFAMDDILIEVEQPVMDISNDGPYKFQEPVNLVSEYDMESFKNLFGNDFSNVKYRWEYSPTKNGTWTTKESGSYTAGSNMPYAISKFEKDNTSGQGNGFYRLTVATSGNMDNSFCSIRKTFEINELKDKCYVTICQDGTKTIQGYTLNATDPSPVDKGSIEFYIDVFKYDELDDFEEETCVKEPDFPSVGRFFKESLTTYKNVDGSTRCIATKQDVYTVVIATPKAPTKHLCQGQKDRNGTAYSNVSEDGSLEITFDSLGCDYSQVVLVHKVYDEFQDTIVCLGETFDSKKYSTPGTFKGNKKIFKTIYGCDSAVTHNIIVPDVAMSELIEHDPICQGETTVKVGSKIFSDPMDKIVYDTLPGASYTGCDSIIKAHVVIYPSGAVGPIDTLICRDQILFGEEFTKATEPNKPLRRVVKGENSLGCPNDTLWDITVVEVQLKLRVAFMGDNPVICQGTPLDLVVTLLPSDADFRWEPSIGSNSMKPTIWPDKTTKYTAFADLDLPSDIDHDAKGCHASAELTVEVHPQPVLSIDSVDTDKRNVEYSVDGGTKPYNLYVDGKNVVADSDDYFGTIEKQPFGNHTLQLLDSIGCASESKFSIEPKPLEPEVFLTPNFDGQNDRWAITNIDIYPTARVKVYDRLGRIVYKCDGNYTNENGFDGTYNGKKLPATDYWYEIDIEELDKQYIGHFTLLR